MNIECPTSNIQFKNFAEICYGTVDDILTVFFEQDILSDEEKKRLDKFVYEKDRKVFTAGHTLKRNVLSKYADIPPVEWKFKKGIYGRPEIANKENLFFNISRTSGMVCCLVSNIAECGVDLENNGRKVDFREVAQQVFTPQEIDYCFTSEKETRKRFFQLWCLKEAYMKALGMGFNLDPLSFSFHIKNNKAVLVDKPDWQFQFYQIENDFTFASALNSSVECQITIKAYSQ